MIARIFLHGPGGSGKTYMLTRVILPVYEHFLPIRRHRGAELRSLLNHTRDGSLYVRTETICGARPTEAVAGQNASIGASMAACGSGISR